MKTAQGLMQNILIIPVEIKVLNYFSSRMMLQISSMYLRKSKDPGIMSSMWDNEKENILVSVGYTPVLVTLTDFTECGSFVL